MSGEGQAGPSATFPEAREIVAALQAIPSMKDGEPVILLAPIQRIVDRVVAAALRASEADRDHLEWRVGELLASARASEAALAEEKDRRAETVAMVATMTKERDAIRKLYNSVHDNLLRANLALELSRAEATKAEMERIVKIIETSASRGYGADFNAHIAAIRAPRPPEPEHTTSPKLPDTQSGGNAVRDPWCDDCKGYSHTDDCPSSPPPPSASGLLLTLKRAANLLDCGAALRTSECSPADPCAACLVHADVEAEIRKLEAPPPSEEPRRYCQNGRKGCHVVGYHRSCSVAVPSPSPTREEPPDPVLLDALKASLEQRKR